MGRGRKVKGVDGTENGRGRVMEMKKKLGW